MRDIELVIKIPEDILESAKSSPNYYPTYHDYTEIADEFCANDSGYQAEVINSIGAQFTAWAYDKRKTSPYIQFQDVAKQLDERGEWFIKILHDYIVKKQG